MTEKTIEILRDKICAGKPVKVGDVVAVPVKEANYMIATGAAKVSEKPKPKSTSKRKNKMVKADELETR